METKSSETKDEAGDGKAVTATNAQQHVEEALNALVELMRRSGSDSVRLAAARDLLDRACGKAGAPGGVEATDTMLGVNETLAAMRERARRARHAG